MILEDLVTIIYKQLKALTALPIHKNSRPSTASGQYFVINCLGVNAGIPDQAAVVNVNGYTPDITGKPDNIKLKEMTNIAMELDEQLKDNLYIYFKKQGIQQEAELNSHFTNVQFDVIINN
mgnify:CR=1 FL=1